MKIEELQNKVPKGSQKRYKHPFATDDPDKYIGKWEKYDKPQGIKSKEAKKVLKGNQVSEGIRTDVELIPISLDRAQKIVGEHGSIVYANLFVVGSSTYLAFADRDDDYPGLFWFNFTILINDGTSGDLSNFFPQTNKGNAISVYNGALSSLVNFVKKHSPPAIGIEGSTSSQTKLYEKYAAKLIKDGILNNYFIAKQFKYPVAGLIFQHKFKRLKEEANALPGGPWPQKGDYKSAPHDTIPNDDIIDFFGDDEKNPGSKAPTKYVKKQNKKLNTDSFKKPFEESSLATSKGHKSTGEWNPSFIPDPEDAPSVANFEAPGKGENGIRFIIDLGVSDDMKNKAGKKDNRKKKSVDKVTEMIRRPSQRNFTADYEIVSNNGEEEIIGKAIVEEGVITLLSVKEASSRSPDEILKKLLGSIVKEADMANANLSIRVEDRHDLDIVRFLERFGFRHVGEGVLKRNAGSASPPLM